MKLDKNAERELIKKLEELDDLQDRIEKIKQSIQTFINAHVENPTASVRQNMRIREGGERD